MGLVARLILLMLLFVIPAHASVTGWSIGNHLRTLTPAWPGQLPFLISAWVHIPTGADLTGSKTIVHVGDSTSNNHRWNLNSNTITGNENINAQSRDLDTTAQAISTATAPNDAWFHGAGAYILDTGTPLRSAYRETVKVDNSTDTGAAINTPTGTGIGANYTGGGVMTSTVSIAEVSIWDVAGFSATERDNLVVKLGTLVGGSSALSPMAIDAEGGQPWTGKLVYYWRLLTASDLASYKGTNTLSVLGTVSTGASHPSVDAPPVAGGPRRIMVIQ